MEEFIGKLWHNWVTKTAAGHYPEAAVKMSEVEKTAGILFRAPDNVIAEFPQFPVEREYSGLMAQIRAASARI